MCYNITSSLKTQLKKAIRDKDEKAINDLLEKLKIHTGKDYYQLSGFSHEKVFIYTNKAPEVPIHSVWGLIPSWVKSEEQKVKLWNSTLNARGESIFEKPAFRDAAKHSRCVLHVDGFYEHHYFKSKNYPYLIQRVDMEPISFGGLFSEWLDKFTGEIINSFSIVTTRGNELLSKIHNNPKMTEPRMPLILNEKDEEMWLQNETSEAFYKEISSLIKPNTEFELKAHTVHRLNGKESLGNTPEAMEEFIYPELNDEPTLFD